MTGACYLLEHFTPLEKPSRILIDCGLFQGGRQDEFRNLAKFPMEMSMIDAVVVTHAHIDHVGRIPKLVKDGYRGKIYSTPATRELAEIMLLDAMGVRMKEEKKRGYSRKTDAPSWPYQKEDIERAMSQWEDVEYGRKFSVGDFKINLREAGHILGSSMIMIEVGGKHIIFTGDMGNVANPLLKEAEDADEANFIVIESAYGDRVHEDIGEANLKLERVIEDTVKKGGVLMIPAFSLERTQKLLFEINNLVEHGRIPQVPIFLDSPLAIEATRIYKKYERYYNDGAKEIIRSGDALFNFPRLKLCATTEESKEINGVPAPKIIIAGSGMSTGGRIVHHEVRYLSDSKSAILLVGYQSAGSLGRQLTDGAREVTILGETIPVRAKVETVSGYSAHADMDKLFGFVRHAADYLEKVFVVQGELKSETFFTQRLRDYIGVDAAMPKTGDSVEFEV